MHNCIIKRANIIAAYLLCISNIDWNKNAIYYEIINEILL